MAWMLKFSLNIAPSFPGGQPRPHLWNGRRRRLPHYAAAQLPPQRLTCICNCAADGIRINKCFKTSHSRRQSDELINKGRVRVNGKVRRQAVVGGMQFTLRRASSARKGSHRLRINTHR
jgi:hypothetical protein